jgi:hypothetical protein
MFCALDVVRVSGRLALPSLRTGYGQKRGGISLRFAGEIACSRENCLDREVWLPLLIIDCKRIILKADMLQYDIASETLIFWMSIYAEGNQGVIHVLA